MKLKIQDMIISPASAVRDAMAAIDRGAHQIALVVDTGGFLTATVTDGDIRRNLLRGINLDDPITEVIHGDPLTVRSSASAEDIRKLMRKSGLNHIPILDDQGRLTDLAWIGDLSATTSLDTHVVIMAGGLGMRLRPLTETLPKPMLSVGGKPLLELIISNLTNQGFGRFTISLNYLGHIVREYFGDGARLNAEIDYVEETEKMGTAGALSLLPERPQNPFLVMNGDLLTSIRFKSLLDFHAETSPAATMCAREFSMEVPYGVIETQATSLIKIREKPIHNHLVNAGIYVLTPNVLDMLETGIPLDMPMLLERLMGAGDKVSVFPISEYWMDIGQAEDLERAQQEYDMIFNSDKHQRVAN